MLSNGQPVSKTNGLSVASTDYAGLGVHNTVFGEQTTAERKDYISILFMYGLSTQTVVITNTGTGTATEADSLAKVSTGASVGLSSIASRNAIRYRAGHEIVVMFTSAFVPATGTNLRHGISNGSNGFDVGCQGSTFGIWHKNGGVETFTARADWTGNKLDATGDSDEYILNPAGLNIYKIQFGYLGIAPVIFSVYAGRALGWVELHTIDQTNTAPAAAHSKNPHLPITMSAERLSGSGAAATIESGSWRGGVVGATETDNTSDRWFAHAIVDASLAIARNNILTLRSKDIFYAKENHIRAQIAMITIVVDGNKSVAWYATKNGTLTGNSTFADKDTTNSIMQISTGGTVSGGERGAATVFLKTAQRRDDVRGTGFYIYPGEDLTIECEPGAVFNGTVSLAVRWIEEF